MAALYNIALSFFYASMHLAAAFNARAAAWVAGRKRIGADLARVSDMGARCRILVHCASVGEYEQARPLLDLLRRIYPGSAILCSFFSPSGYGFVREKYPEEWICYLPYDRAADMRQFLEKLSPSLVFIIKYEFWYHFLTQCRKGNIPVFMVSGIFRKEQAFFKSWGSLHREMLQCFKHFFVQEEGSAALLRQAGFDNVTVAGDTRFERVLELRHTSFEDSIIQQFCAGAQVCIAGSAWNSDLPVLNRILQALPGNWKMIVAPHQPEHFEAGKLAEPFVRYTQGGEGRARILLLDTMGLLSRVYRFGNVAYVGGGFGKGIHNILEAVVYGIPVLIGPEHRKFHEAEQLLQAGCAFEVKPENASGLLEEMVFNNLKSKEIAARLEAYIAANTNVSEKIEVYLQSKYPAPLKVF